LASGLTAAGQGEAAAQEGTLAGQAQRTQSLMQQLAMARQAREDAITNQLHQSTTDLNRVKTAAGGFKPTPPPVPGWHYDETNQTWVQKPTMGTPPSASPPEGDTPQGGPVQPPSPTAPTLRMPTLVPTGLAKKPAPMTPHTFTEDGQAVQGFASGGKFFRADGTPATGKIGVYQAPDRTTVLVSDPSNPSAAPTITRRANLKGGEQAPQPGGAQARATQTLGEIGLTEMEQAHKTMLPIEADLKSGKIPLTGLDQFMRDVGNNFTADDMKSTAARAIALTRLGQVNPRMAEYARAGIQYAEGESKFDKRPSDFRTKMAEFLSTVPTGFTPQMVDNIQSRRDRMVTRARKTFGGTSSVAPDAGADPHTDFATRALALQKAGLGKAAIAAQLADEGWDVATGTKKAP
jgi:hypothetical protein